MDSSIGWYFAPVSTPQPAVYDLPGEGNWRQGHLGFGTFLTRNNNSGPDDEPGISYSAGATQVHLFQACDGDTNGDGNLNGDDIQAILATNLFPTQGYVSPPWGPQPPKAGGGAKATGPGQPGDGIVDLILYPDDGMLVINTDDVTINSYVIVCRPRASSPATRPLISASSRKTPTPGSAGVLPSR